MRFKYLYILAISFLLGLSTAFSQPGGDPGGGDDPDNPVPITGLEILLVSGAALGLKRLNDLRKKM